MHNANQSLDPSTMLAQAEASFVVEKPVPSPIDTVEDMLELAEGVQIARNYLSERYHELQPAPDELPKEHHERLISHARFLRDVGKISTRDWEKIGLGDEDEIDDPDISGRVATVLSATDARYVSSLTRPDWEERFPDADNPESLQAWEDFKQRYPEDMQVMLEELYVGTRRLKDVHENTELFSAFQERKDARFDVLMTASCVRALERSGRDMRERADRLRRTIPEGISAKAVMQQAKELEKRAAHFEHQAAGLYVEGKQQKDGKAVPVYKEAVVAELQRRAHLDDRRGLRHGLLITPEMERLVDDFLPQAVAGKPILLVGETGGAKTAAAEHLARSVNRQLGKDPDAYEFVSGYGQLNSYQLMGKDVLRGEFTEFVYGAASRAMKNGTPLIVDEINATDPTDIQKRFNKMLQLKPGDTFQIQEDGGERIVVKQGFCIITTANEKSARYKSTHEMSADFKARFGANVGRVSYPDLAVLPGQVPQTLLRLAQATVVDRYGKLPNDNPALDPATILRFVGSCHRLQRMFAIPLEDLNATEKQGLEPGVMRNAGNGQTALNMETISPRLMNAILDDLVQGGRSGVTLQAVLNRFVEGVSDLSDRTLIRATLQADKLL